MFQTLEAWVRKNLRSPTARGDFVRKAQAAEATKRDWHSVISAQLTRTRVAYLIYAHGGELFMFALTDSQALQLGAPGPAMQFVVDGLTRACGPEPPFHLEEVTLVGSDNLDLRQPVRGTCRYRIARATSFCLRLEILLERPEWNGNTRLLTLYHYPLTLRSDNRLEFEFLPFRPPVGDPHEAVVAPQLTVAFASICTPPPSGQEAEPLSNVLGVLAKIF